MLVALTVGMLAATLIPLMFILGLTVLLALGAWDVGLLVGTVILALLVGVGVGVARMVRNSAKPAKSGGVP